MQYLEDPGDEERQAILGPLLASNLERGPPLDLRQFTFLIRGDGDRTIGGLWGRTAYDWAVIELLYVPSHMRGTGTGRSLVQHAENLARERLCRGIWLDSFGFQAPGFYQKLGYEIFGELPNNPIGQSRYFLRKFLT
ncbi:GNAT family N-acetyltransferase [Thioclava sp. BHET1]|nr:GNAT family N-acetyltransferase [Thioclava sp. BHET1]